MKCRHEWRTLPAGSDVTAAEIGDDRDPRLLGETRGIGELGAVAEIGAVADGLPVKANRCNIARFGPCLREERGDCAGAAIHQCIGCERSAVDEPACPILLA